MPTVAATQKAGAKIELERSSFRALLLSNPNYFGTIKGSKLQPVNVFSRNTSYEELMCVGFHPQLSQLEGVVHVKQNAGYSESLCGGGSSEYVRFFTSADGGATWHDDGLVTFHAFNVAGPRPLEYAVTLGINPRRSFCFTERLLKVRAILSWNVPPAANDPDYIPVWGNVVSVDVQLEPRRLWDWHGLLEELAIKLPKPLDQLAVVSGPIDLTAHAEMPLAQLYESYAKAKVPAHRYLYEHLAKADFGSSAADAALPAAGGLSEALIGLKIDISHVIAALAQTDGNTDYEQLSCVGYDPNNDALIGVIKVKKPVGYAGALCTAGSREYVAFWMDWGDGAGWTYAGTSSVQVHDIASIQATGLFYAVFEAISSAKHRRACLNGPVTARVRAILSWQTAPPPGNADWVPHWGNREETEIQLNPGAVSDDYRPMLESVSTVPVCSIDQGTGMTAAVYSRPFGGVLTITGLIPTAPDIATPDPNKLRYRVRVRKLNPPGSWQTVDNDFSISVIERIGMALPTQYSILQQVDGGGWYTYREDMNVAGAGWRLVQNRVLAQWITASPMTGLYEIMVEARDPVTNVIYAAQAIGCGDGTTRTNVKVWLDELRPVVAVSLTGFQHGGGPVQPAAVCGTFQVGDILHGTYSVSDEHSGAFSLSVQPAAMAHGAAPVPGSKTYPVLPNLGENGTWTLDTSGMDPCGYVVRLYAHDRTIVSSGYPWDAETFIGFCLKKG